MSRNVLLVLASAIVGVMALSSFFSLRRTLHCARCVLVCSSAEIAVDAHGFLRVPDDDRAHETMREDLWRVRGFVKRFTDEHPPQKMTTCFLERFPEHDGNQELVSNVFACSSMLVSDSPPPLVSFTVASVNERLAQDVVTFCADAFRNWVARQYRLAYEKNTAQLRNEIERDKKNGMHIDPAAQEKLNEAKRIIDKDKIRTWIVHDATGRRMGGQRGGDRPPKARKGRDFLLPEKGW